MVWDEIKRILTGADDEGASSGKKAAARSSALPDDADQEIGALATPEVSTSTHLPGDVSVQPNPVQVGQPITIEYGGTLAQRGAAGITLHCGYGEEAWRHVQDITMTPVGPDRWRTTVFSEHIGTFNFCFRDTAGNWDNRGGQNWSVNILPSS